MNQDLELQVRAARGITTEIDRSELMPFHVTLLGVFCCEMKRLAPKDNNTQGDSEGIYQRVTNISNKFGDQRIKGQYAANGV